MVDLLQEKLRDLLSKAQAAHHDFEATELGGEFDEQWPAWYAQFLEENGIGGLLVRELDLDLLAAKLEEVSQRHKTVQTAENWAEYTARELIHNPPSAKESHGKED